MATYYIGADVHSNNTQLAFEQRGKIIARYSVPTTIPAISTVLSSVQGKKILAIEEGPMAGWLYRNLNQEVDKLIVSEPRRNKLITSEGDSVVSTAIIPRLVECSFVLYLITWIPQRKIFLLTEIFTI